MSDTSTSLTICLSTCSCPHSRELDWPYQSVTWDELMIGKFWSLALRRKLGSHQAWILENHI
jgi:hypothetical protein